VRHYIKFKFGIYSVRRFTFAYWKSFSKFRVIYFSYVVDSSWL